LTPQSSGRLRVAQGGVVCADRLWRRDTSRRRELKRAEATPGGRGSHPPPGTGRRRPPRSRDPPRRDLPIPLRPVTSSDRAVAHLLGPGTRHRRRLGSGRKPGNSLTDQSRRRPPVGCHAPAAAAAIRGRTGTQPRRFDRARRTLPCARPRRPERLGPRMASRHPHVVDDVLELSADAGAGSRRG
jgi:hypothetical protein